MSMKYYVYISDTKVDMLYSQIPKSIRDKIAVELGINLGMFSLSVKEKQNQEKTPLETRIEKLRLVEKYIEKNMDVGTVGQPKAYFKGSLPMRWGPFTTESELVYFGSETTQTILGLGGSRANVIGGKRMGESEPTYGGSTTSEIRVTLCRELNLPDGTYGDSMWDTIHEGDILFATNYATKSMKGPLQTFEFLAKRLVETAVEDRPLHVLLGTPLYVAMID